MHYSKWLKDMSWKTKLNIGCKVGIIYMDLSKGLWQSKSWIINYKTKMLWTRPKCSWIWSYLSNRYQCCKINNALGDCRKIIAGVPQVSILGPLLFNLFLNDIFLFLKDANLGNYADDSTLYAYNNNLETLLVI